MCMDLERTGPAGAVYKLETGQVEFLGRCRDPYYGMMYSPAFVLGHWKYTFWMLRGCSWTGASLWRLFRDGSLFLSKSSRTVRLSYTPQAGICDIVGPCN